MLIMNFFPFALFTFVNAYVMYQVMALFFNSNAQECSAHEYFRYGIYGAGSFIVLFLLDAPVLYFLWTVAMTAWVAYYYTLDGSEALPAVLTFIGMILFAEVVPILLAMQANFLTGTTVYDANIFAILFFQKVGLLILLLLVQSYMMKEREWVKRPFIAYLFISVVIGLHLIALGINARWPFLVGLIPHERFVLSILLAFSLLLCVTLFERMHALYQEHVRSQFRDQERQKYQRQIERIEAHHTHIQRLEHDVKKHLGIMQSYSAAGDFKALQKYLQNYTQVFHSAPKVLSTGHFIVDILVNDALQRARENGIDFKTDIRIREKLSVDDHDLTTILSNLIENGLDAVCELPEGDRTLKLRIITDKGQLLIETNNPYLSRDEKTIQKGIGLKNVESTAKKYHGDLMVRCNDNGFQTQVLVYFNHRA